MNETFLQFRIDELEQDRLREAAAARLVRQAKAAGRTSPQPSTNPVARLVHAIGGRVQPTSATA